MKKYLLFLSALVLLMACSDTDTLAPSATPPAGSEQIVAAQAVNIKLSADVISQINNNENHLSLPTGCNSLDNYLQSIGAKELYRTFPNSGKFEALHRDNGLNAWYTVALNTDVQNATRAPLKAEAGVVEYIEPVKQGSIGTYNITELSAPQTRAETNAMFNDPYFNRQWDLKNDGTLANTSSVTSSVAGADINIEEAWKKTTGSANVIVAVVDGGIDITHPDLKDNLWINTGEIPGNGIDDDNNGYIDDVNGFNFVDGNGTIVAHDHGTHVAGTIAAATNNGIGISGIAGGNGTAGSGTKVMSCQIFKPNPDYDPNDPDSKENLTTDDKTMAAAIVYGADNGAVISQNSWGFTSPGVESQVVKEAIQYFNAQAGRFEGSPVKGGVTIFAAGNDHSGLTYYPAAYDDAISVSAYAPDYTATWYTNYGYPTDICAPGGTSPYNGKYPRDDAGYPVCEILSTLPVKDGKARYGYMQGTSMACPHVSGIAALVAAQFQGKDFTAQQLRNHILTGISAQNINERNTEAFQDRLGIGYADAAMALETFNADAAPANPVWSTDAEKTDFTSLTVGWTATNIASHPVFKYVLYFSKEPITEANLSSAAVTRITIPAANAAQGHIFTRTMNGLSTGTPYHFALKSVARGGKESALTVYPHALSTKVNLPPVITPNVDLSKPLIMAGNDRMDISFGVTDPEGQNITYTMSNKSGLYITTTNEAINLRFFAANMMVGTNKYVLTVEDQYGASSSLLISIIKAQDKVPALSGNASIELAKGEERTLDLTQMVDDEDPQSVSFALQEVGSTNVQVVLNGGKLSVKGNKLGEASIKVSATDRHSQASTLTIPVLVYMDKGIAGLFPTLAENTLYVKLGSDVSGPFTLTIRNAAGKQVLQQKHDTAKLDPVKRTLVLTVSKLFPGKYTLSIANNGKTYQETFIKK